MTTTKTGIIRRHKNGANIRPLGNANSWIYRALTSCGLVTGIIVASFAPAGAVILINKDDIAYEYSITEGEGYEEHKLAPKETTGDLCVSCMINVKNVGDVLAQGNDRIIVENGKITLEMQ